MKRLQQILLFLFPLLLHSQQVDLTFQVDELKQKIQTTERGERLMWMDSLSRLIHDREDFQYDSVVKQTIDYSLELDSTRLALKHSVSLIAYTYSEIGQPERAIEIFNDLRNKVPKNQYYLELSYFYINGGDSYERVNRLEEAVDIYEEAYDLAIKINDSTVLGIIKDRIGTALCLMGDFQGAATMLQDAGQILKENSPESAWKPKITLAILYSQNGLQKMAKKIRQEILADARIRENNRALYSGFYDQAYDEMLHGSQKERLRNIDSARAYVSKLEDEFNFQEILVAQLSAYSENGLLEKAKIVKRELEEKRKNNEFFELEEYNLAMAWYEYALGNYRDAAKWGEKEYNSIKNTQFYEGIYLAHGFLSKVYDRLGNTEKGYTHFKKYHKIKDSIETVQKANGFSYYQTLYETEKKDAEIEAHKSEIDLLNAKNRSKNLWIIFGGFGVAAVFSIIYLWRVQHFTRKKQQMHTLFSRHLVKGQESERIRLARELHDGVGQKLALLTKKVKQTGNVQVDSLAQNTLEELRNVSRQLYPVLLEKLGLSGALKSMVDEIDANTDIFFTHEIDHIDDTITKEISLHLYRIVQEVLNNIVKHSRAKTCFVNVEQEAEAVEIEIKDDGIGFVFRERLRESSSLGLRMLMERAKIIQSKFRVHSEPMKGTRVSVIIPI